MRLIDVLLEIRKDDSKYAINNHGYGIRYKKDKDIMVYCDRETGEYSNNIIVISIWSYDNLFADGWRTKTVIVPKYKIGDRFLFKNLCHGISKQGKTALSQTFTNVIGEIEKYTYIEPDRIFYTIHLEEGKFTLLLNEEYLSTLDMVVSQGVMK